MVKNQLFEAQNLPFLVVFVLFEILELFEYLMAKYSIFEVQLFLLELEALDVISCVTICVIRELHE